jgi:hypothetical protein
MSNDLLTFLRGMLMQPPAARKFRQEVFNGGERTYLCCDAKANDDASKMKL